MTESEAEAEAKALWSQWELLELQEGHVYRRLPATGDRPEYLLPIVHAELQKDYASVTYAYVCRSPA